jgi:hypothetical protein
MKDLKIAVLLRINTHHFEYLRPLDNLEEYCEILTRVV